MKDTGGTPVIRINPQAPWRTRTGTCVVGGRFPCNKVPEHARQDGPCEIIPVSNKLIFFLQRDISISVFSRSGKFSSCLPDFAWLESAQPAGSQGCAYAVSHSPRFDYYPRFSLRRHACRCFGQSGSAGGRAM